jgi:hypothetical protein
MVSTVHTGLVSKRIKSLISVTTRTNMQFQKIKLKRN